MAEGLVRHYYGDRFNVESAGAMPTSINPNAMKVMGEIGIDISNQRSKPVEEFMGKSFDHVITLCDDNSKEVCPTFNGDAGERLHWNFQDPVEARGVEEEVLQTYRAVRDGIRESIDRFVKELDENA
jgi:arsenate reductase